MLTALVDGQPIGSAAFSSTIPDPAASLWLGDAEDQHSGRNYRGSLDDVRIYSRALSTDEIGKLANVPLFASIWLLCAGLIGVIGAVRLKRI
ncbi:hypothetical protein D1AOALGA4SA_12010 [Olavius algarvensis Delta 1 endosymbiont]|nr:hypothetical protein D1AOALGA4SA_12010 [Olavius algarvensis Delta 1 endosymbiont]